MIAVFNMPEERLTKRRIEPRWEDYIKDRRSNLVSFVVSLKEDHTFYEETYKLLYRNPTVIEPAKSVDGLIEEARFYWHKNNLKAGNDFSDRAALRQIEVLFNVCKTTAGSRILDARASIEEERTDDRSLSLSLKWHKEARREYGVGGAINIAFNQAPALTLVRSVDRAMYHYQLAIRAAGNAFCSAE